MKRKPHGGKRQGAGRPKTATARVRVQAYVLPTTLVELERWGVKPGGVLDEWVEREPDRPGEDN